MAAVIVLAAGLAGPAGPAHAVAPAPQAAVSLGTAPVLAERLLTGEDRDWSRPHIDAIEERLFQELNKVHWYQDGKRVRPEYASAFADAALLLSQVALFAGEPGAATRYLDLVRAADVPESDRIRNWRAVVTAIGGRIAAPPQRGAGAPAPCIGSGACAGETQQAACRSGMDVGYFADLNWSRTLAEVGPKGACAATMLAAAADIFRRRSRDDMAEPFYKAAIAAAALEPVHTDDAADVATQALSRLVILLCDQGRLVEARVYLGKMTPGPRDGRADAYLDMARERLASEEAPLNRAAMEIMIATGTLDGYFSRYPEWQSTAMKTEDGPLAALIDAFHRRARANFVQGSFAQALADNTRLLFFARQAEWGWSQPACMPGPQGDESVCRKWVAGTIDASDNPLLALGLTERAAIEAKLGHDADALADGTAGGTILTNWLRGSWSAPRSVAATLRERRSADAHHLAALDGIYRRKQAEAAPALALAFQTLQLLQYGDAEADLRQAIATAAITDLKVRDIVQQRADLLRQRAVAARSRTGILTGLDDQIAKLELALPFPVSRLDQRTAFMPLTIAQAQSQLKPDEALLVLATMDDKTAVLALTASGSAWMTAPVGRNWIEARTQRLLSYLRSNRADGAQYDGQAAWELYHTLMEPMQALIGSRVILSSVSGPLAAVPLTVLRTHRPGDGKGPMWVGQTNAILALPSVSSLALVRSSPAARRQTALMAFGDPAFNPAQRTRLQASGVDLRPLVRAKAEIALLRAAMGPLGPVGEFTGPRFTKVAVMRENLTDIRVLEFATHAVAAGDSTMVTEPALLVTPGDGKDGAEYFLSISDVAGMRINADLVLLSACNSAVDTRDEGPIAGLARAFLFAGARGIVASKWPVDDRAAELIIGAGVSGATATPIGFAKNLRQKIDAFVTQRPGDLTADPRFWGPFIVIGG